MDQLYAEHLSVLRRCKLEEIHIPLEDDQSLNDIPIEQLEVILFVFEILEHLLTVIEPAFGGRHGCGRKPDRVSRRHSN